MEITFFNPDDAMCVRLLCPASITKRRPPQKITLLVRIHCLRTAYVSSVPLDTFNIQLAGQCAGYHSHLLGRIGCTLLLPSDLSDNSSRIVAAKPTPKLRAASLARSPDTRRNLYVLGLPFDLSLWVSHFVIRATLQRQSRSELESVFSHFGTVTHSVILATVDNASRRRGFVVMSTHAQAKAAMDNISQTNIRCVAATA